MTELHHFLAARIYEDELKAEAAKQRGVKLRLQRDVKAKQGILLDYMGKLSRWEAITRAGSDAGPRPLKLALKYLALPYADHPDYEPAWTPPEPGTVETWGRY